MGKQLTREDILLPVLAAWAHEEISIGRARELLHMPDDKIREEAEKRVSNAVKEREYRDLLEHQIQDLGMMLRRLIRRVRPDSELMTKAEGLLKRCGVNVSPLREEDQIERLQAELKLHREAWDEIAKAALNHDEKALVEEHRPREGGE